MSRLEKNKATICIVNYKTLDFTRLCLRSIRKFTDYPYEIVVVDNDSNDDSVEYLRSLKWIRLIERHHQHGQPRGSYDHSAALDMGLSCCNTEFYTAMHSDVFVKKHNWLTELVSYFNDDEKIACVGSGKIELAPQWLEILKKLTDFRTLGRSLFGTPAQRAKYRYHNRAICCLYRTETLQREGLSFLMGQDQGLTAGQKLYFELVDRGYKTVELPPSIMWQYITHLAHATQAINPREFKLRDRTHRKFHRTIDRIMSSPLVQEILADDSLDR